jgi:hypothetical protein
MAKKSAQERLAEKQLKDREAYGRQVRAQEAQRKRDEKAQWKRDMEIDRAQGRSGGYL